jgi:hypothetical protein
VYAPSMSGLLARMKRLISATVCVWFMRATMRLPSESRSWIEVVGCDSSTPSHSPGGAELAAAAAAAWLLLAPLLPPKVLPEPENATYLEFTRQHAEETPAKGQRAEGAEAANTSIAAARQPGSLLAL